MKILRPHDCSGWITVEIGKYVVEAKVYDCPSDYGIKSGRVSKLSVVEKNSRKEVYSYDRGTFYGSISVTDLDNILLELNTIPPSK